MTVLTCQSGQTVLRQLEQDLKNSDLMSLRRLLVVHITLQQSLSDRSPACSLETPSSEDDHEGRRTYLSHDIFLLTEKVGEHWPLSNMVIMFCNICQPLDLRRVQQAFLIPSVLRKKEKEISYITQQISIQKGFWVMLCTVCTFLPKL